MVSEHALTVTRVTQTKDTGSYSEKYSKKLDVSYPSLINATGNELVRAVSELPDVAKVWAQPMAFNFSDESLDEPIQT